MEKGLKIKLGVVKRCTKELIYYRKEYVVEQERMDKVAEDRRSQQSQVIEESLVMITETKKRLVAGVKDLRHHVEEVGLIEGTAHHAEVTEALSAAEDTIAAE